jgi:hypothetical protein
VIWSGLRADFTANTFGNAVLNIGYMHGNGGGARADWHDYNGIARLISLENGRYVTRSAIAVNNNNPATPVTITQWGNWNFPAGVYGAALYDPIEAANTGKDLIIRSATGSASNITQAQMNAGFSVQSAVYRFDVTVEAP